MKTVLKTIHEEKYPGDNKSIGIIINFSGEFLDPNEFSESFVYIYNKGIYIIFDTMIDMFDYLLNGDIKTRRAYIEELEYDRYYDNPFEGKFGEKLEWIEEPESKDSN